MPPDRLMTEEETAEFISMAPQTLSVWRITGRYGLPYRKIGRNVSYLQSEVKAWLDARKVTSTGQAETI